MNESSENAGTAAIASDIKMADPNDYLKINLQFAEAKAISQFRELHRMFMQLTSWRIQSGEIKAPTTEVEYRTLIDVSVMERFEADKKTLLSDIESRIQEAMTKLGSRGMFVRLSTRSPKDSALSSQKMKDILTQRLVSSAPAPSSLGAASLGAESLGAASLVEQVLSSALYFPHPSSLLVIHILLYIFIIIIRLSIIYYYCYCYLFATSYFALFDYQHYSYFKSKLYSTTIITIFVFIIAIIIMIISITVLNYIIFYNCYHYYFCHYHCYYYHHLVYFL